MGVLGYLFKAKVEIPTFPTTSAADDWFKYAFFNGPALKKMFGKQFYIARDRFQKSEYYPLSPGYVKRHATLVQTGATWIS